MNVLIIGAHPDDCESEAGGTAALWRERGDRVRFVSMTNGDAGHPTLDAVALARRRRQEALDAARVIGAECEILDNRDGELLPGIENRQQVIRLMRQFRPDLVVTHRPNDYHPDHRATAILVQDAAYLVTVPKICPDVPRLSKNPVIAYLFDAFERPAPFRADVAVDIDQVVDLKWRMMHAHSSQFYEWLPFNDGTAAEVPAGDAERLAWLARRWRAYCRRDALAARSALERYYGKKHAAGVEFAEAFELCEFGGAPDFELREDAPQGDTDSLRELFPVPPG